MEAILALVVDKPRPVDGKFLMSVDHCFAVKGHGTVLTGTVLQVSALKNLRILNYAELSLGCGLKVWAVVWGKVCAG